MDKITVYKLKFDTPLHIAAHGVGYEKTETMLHSDTLFSALMSLWHHFYDDDDIQKMCESPPFLISSGFPFKGSTCFFPRPMERIGREGEDDPRTGKKLKRVKFISQSLFESLLKGDSIDFNEAHTFQDGMFWTDTTASESDRVFAVREVPRIAVDRESYASNIFYFSEVLFEADAGLFFLARFREKAIQSKFEAILKLLGDEGIGGDKRLGKGLFSVGVGENFSLSLPGNADGFLTLSLYYPTQEEFAGISGDASYNLISRKGWIHSPGAMSLRRQEVRMFSEGSVFRSLGQPVYGKTPCVLNQNTDMGLEHNVYRYGFAFDLPIVRKGGHDGT
ncbi:MAG: type III-A CRISPR-associated RAMP protein Csm4 [Deltaproteobacteria bacterium]|nr:MAG: type III-A CRISPR-associated RAMP protein Csm4 [Deltaproteobacteria bacterium]